MMEVWNSHGSVELSWKWDMLKLLIRYADPMLVCIGDTQTNQTMKEIIQQYNQNLSKQFN